MLAPGTIHAQAQQPITLSLDSCIAIALSDNPTIRVADMEITRMDYSKKETLGQLLPSIAFGASYNRTLAKQTMYMNMSGFGGSKTETPSDADADDTDTSAEKPASSSSSSSAASNGGIKVGLDNSFSMGFSFSMPLIAPQLWKSLKLSDAQILQSVEKARQSRIQMVNQVKNAYYALLLALDSHDVIQQSYDMARFTADLYQKQHSVGAASEYDVLRTQVAVQNVEPELAQSLIAIRQAKLQLLILMGMDTAYDINPTRRLESYRQTMYADALAFDRSDLSGNSELRMLDIQTRQLRDALQVQKMAWYPTLALSGNYNWTSMSNGSPFKNFRWSPYSMIGLTLSVPLFEGGQRYHRIKQAQIQVNEMKWQRENLQRSIAMQAELALDNIEVNIKQINSCNESVRQATKAHDIMSSSFEIGAASYLDLRDSELALTRSQLTYYQAIYNYLVAGADLELLLGNAKIQ